MPCLYWTSCPSSPEHPLQERKLGRGKLFPTSVSLCAVWVKGRGKKALGCFHAATFGLSCKQA